MIGPREDAATGRRGSGYTNLRNWATEIGSTATAGDIADVRFYGVNTITSSVVHLKVSGDHAVNDWVWGAGKTDTGAGLPAWESMAGVERLPGHTAGAAGVLGCRDGSGCGGGGIFTRCDKRRHANLWSFEERTFGESPDSTGRHDGCVGRCWERRLQQEERPPCCPTLGCLLRQVCNNGAPGGWAGEISVHQVWVRMKQDVVLVNGIDPSPEHGEGGCIEIVKEHVPEQPPTPGVLTLLKQASLDEDTVENMAMPDDVPLELQNLMVREVRGSVAEDDRCFVCNGTGERHVAMNMVYGEEAAAADEERTHDAVHFLLEKMAGVAVSATATLHRDEDTRPASFTLGGVLRDPSGLVLEARPMNTSGHSVFRSLLHIKAILPKSAAASASGINLAVNDVVVSAGGRDIAGYTVERAMKVIDELMRTEGGVLKLLICRGVVASGDMHGGDMHGGGSHQEETKGGIRTEEIEIDAGPATAVARKGMTKKPSRLGEEKKGEDGGGGGSGSTILSFRGPSKSGANEINTNKMAWSEDSLDRCWVCRGTGKSSSLLGSMQLAERVGEGDGERKAEGKGNDEDDEDVCSICWTDPPKYGISTQCTHFFCGDCVHTHLNTELNKGAFPAYCPMCRSDAPAGKEPAYGRIDGKAMTFLERKGVIDKEFQFRFMKKQDEDTAEMYFKCPSNCGNFLVDKDPEYRLGKGGKVHTKVEKCPCGTDVCPQCHQAIKASEVSNCVLYCTN